jgi:hypothetical protein
METTCAVCRLTDGLVMNTIIAAPSDPAPNGCQLVEIMTGQLCNIGWFYVNDVFNGPRNYAMCSTSEDEVVSFFSVSYISPIPATPEGYYSIEVPVNTDCGIGWIWDGVTFNPPIG